MKSFIKICIGLTILWPVAFVQEPNVVWTKTFGGNMGDKAYSVQQTSDGGFIIAGETYSFGANKQAYIIKVDALGNLQWQRSLGTSGSDDALHVQQTSDGGFIATGTYDEFGTGDVFLIKMYPSGALEWIRQINLGHSEWGQWCG